MGPNELSGSTSRGGRTLVWSVRARAGAVRLVRTCRDRLWTSSDRGDVPGWVLVTLMTAGLVAALWLVAEDALTGLFRDAMDSVRGG